MMRGEVMRLLIAIVGACLLFGTPTAKAADPKFVEAIVAAMKKKYPDFNVYCDLPESDRKTSTVDTVLELAVAAKGRYADPMGSGLEAGSKLREACGRETKNYTAADLEMSSPDQIRASAGKAADLKFPDRPSDIKAARQAGMAIYKPEGAGPFPALVIMHRCIAMRSDPDLLQWAQRAVRAGYVAFMVDSVGGRGVDSICYGPKGDITYERGAKDVLQAVEHLKGFDFVDRTRIAATGYSWGAMVSLMSTSKLIRTALGGDGPVATVPFYPACVDGMGIVRSDVDRPALVLMGGSDTEANPADCLKKFEPIKAAGAPLDWFVFPGQTHCWDCPSMSGFKKTDILGNVVHYNYNDAVTQDSAQRMFDFLSRSLSKN